MSERFLNGRVAMVTGGASGPMPPSVSAQRNQSPSIRAASPVLAVIDANFAREQFAPEVVTVWLAFWSQVPHVPALARVQRVYQSRLRSNLRHGLRPLLPSSEVHAVSTGLAALIDGLWLRCALTDGGIGPEAARELARDYVMMHLPSPHPAPGKIVGPNDLI